MSFGQKSGKGLTGASPHHPGHHGKIVIVFFLQRRRNEAPRISNVERFSGKHKDWNLKEAGVVMIPPGRVIS